MQKSDVFLVRVSHPRIKCTQDQIREMVKECELSYSTITNALSFARNSKECVRVRRYAREHYGANVYFEEVIYEA